MASLLPNGEQTFLDDNGNPLANGSVYFYSPGTTTLKDTWQDADELILNTNPVVLDSAGRAIIYGSGVYRQIVKDSAGNTIWDQLTTGITDEVSVFGGDIIGTASALIINPSSPVTALSNGLIVYGYATQNNNAAATLNVSGTGAKDIYSNGATILANVIPDGVFVGFSYDSSLDVWHLLSLEAPSLGPNTFYGTQTLSGAPINEAQGASLASATTVDIGAATGNYLHITGTTTITAFGTAQAGTRRILEFEGALLLTYNATSLILPGGVSITTAAGDVGVFVSEGSGNWRCVGYSRASGQSIVPSGILPLTSQTAANSASLTFTTAAWFTYDELIIDIIDFVPATDGTELQIRFSTDGGATWVTAGNYTYTIIKGYSNTTTVNGVNSGGATGILITPATALEGIGNAANEGYSGTVKFYNLSSTSQYKRIRGEAVYTNENGDTEQLSLAGDYRSATAVNGIQLLMTSGNITSGRASLFAVLRPS